MDSNTPKRLYHHEQVVKAEDAYLLRRRKKLFGGDETEETLEKTRFGIALSGGGIRSATINLGILKTLNQFGLIKRADYLSSVSGGGYTAAYVQATLRDKKKPETLFSIDQIDRLREHGEYMIPGKGWRKQWNRLVLIVGYLVSLVMSWVSPLILLLMLYTFYVLLVKGFEFIGLKQIYGLLGEIKFLEFGMIALLVILSLHFLANIFKKFDIKISRRFNHAEVGLVVIALIWGAVLIISNLKERDFFFTGSVLDNLILLLAVFLLGYLANPNALSFHRFYRAQLAHAFLSHAGAYKNIKLKDMLPEEEAEKEDYLAPYPLVNTCLNLFSSKDPKFTGSKAIDYFLLSPLYCGAKLSNYTSTADTIEYKELTLPAAITISAAAVNPGMGIYSNRILSALVTLLNARLGYWVNNPGMEHSNFPVWWPSYFLSELFSRMGTKKKKLNISDGGHIENLGVIELLRRKCRLVIAVDAGADTEYQFGDLENLTIRARNELGLEIQFKNDQTPEEIIRPKPSHGYSEKRFAIADILLLWEEIKPLDEQQQRIKDKEGKKIEILVNYKRIKDDIRRLDEDGLQSLNECLNLIQSDQLEQTLAISHPTLSSIAQLIYSKILEFFNHTSVAMQEQVEAGLLDKATKKLILTSVIQTMRKRISNRLKEGTFVYIKSSVTAPESKPAIQDKKSMEYKTYKYKIYHPSFPHESTSDQFFDPVQWEAYYRLGQFISADLLGVERLNDYFDGKLPSPRFTVGQLQRHFNEDENLFETREIVQKPDEVPIDQPSPEMELPPVLMSEVQESMAEIPPTETIEEEVREELPPMAAEAGARSSAETADEVEEEVVEGEVEAEEETTEQIEQKIPEKKIVVGGETDYRM